MTKEQPDPEISKRQPLFSVSFDDKTTFILPKDWEDVFVDYYGHDPKLYPEVAESLKWQTGKYVEHKAWPCKFDGIQWEIEHREENPTMYDDLEFYWEPWSKWPEEGKEWGVPRAWIKPPPTYAQVAEAVLYFAMRGGLLQKALQQLGSDTRVVTPEKFLGELKNHDDKRTA